MRRDNNNGRSAVKAVARWAFYATVATLPLGGLVFFFEITRPAIFPANAAIAAELSASFSHRASVGEASPNHSSVVHFKGVSAELSPARLASDAKVLSASDAVRVFASSSDPLKAGFRSEFVTKDGRRVAIRIVSREPILDQALPDEERLIAITPASTAKVVNFVWGAWIYRAELEDKGAEPEVVVQKTL